MASRGSRSSELMTLLPMTQLPFHACCHQQQSPHTPVTAWHIRALCLGIPLVQKESWGLEATFLDWFSLHHWYAYFVVQQLGLYVTHCFYLCCLKSRMSMITRPNQACWYPGSFHRQGINNKDIEYIGLTRFCLLSGRISTSHTISILRDGKKCKCISFRVINSWNKFNTKRMRWYP